MSVGAEFTVGGGGVTATFPAGEAMVVRHLLGALIELLRDQVPGPTGESDDPFAALVGDLGSPEPPEDEVLRRLLPSAYVDDQEAAGDFRRYTEIGLRNQKVAGAQLIRDRLGEPGPDEQVTVILDREEAETWMRALADLRLALGTGLGLKDDDDDPWSELPADDPTRGVLATFDWLGMLQESLVLSVIEAWK